MSEYVFRYANGYGCDMGALMDGGRQTVGEYFASDAADHYGTLHEEIVRCMDCDNLNIVGKCPCGFFAMENLDGFCAWGVTRKEGGE